MIAAMNSARLGMQTNQVAMARRADRISRWGASGVTTTSDAENISLPAEMAGVLQSQRGFEANLKVLEMADRMVGTLLDVLA